MKPFDAEKTWVDGLITLFIWLVAILLLGAIFLGIYLSKNDFQFSNLQKGSSSSERLSVKVK